MNKVNIGDKIKIIHMEGESFTPPKCNAAGALIFSQRKVRL